MSALPITALYAGILGLLLIWLSIRVVQARLGGEVSLGDGGREDLLVVQRGQGNFVEYVPHALILIGLVELADASAWIVHALGASLTIARLMHPFGLGSEFGLRPPRFIGTTITWIVIGVASLLCIYRFVALQTV